MIYANPVELYLKYRPQNFGEVIGQDEAVSTLSDLGRRGVFPHAILFTGPSGCGKTTLARIIAKKLKCPPLTPEGKESPDYQEMNAADCRGIDDIRAIAQRLGTAPMLAACRVIYLDECHGMTSDAQDAFLKLLEDTPPHIYFLLSTTNPNKLKKTILTRCQRVDCKPITEAGLRELVESVALREGKTLTQAVINHIADCSENSGRQALVLLHAVLGLADEKEQLAAVSKVSQSRDAIELVQALVSKKPWASIAAILKELDEDPEGLRRVILGYCSKIVLGAGGSAGRAAMIIEEFWEPLYDIGKPGLVVRCYSICNNA